MPDRTVILTILDQAWARPGSVLELFLESFKIGVGTKKLLNHLVIVTTDDQAFQYCKAMHPHCFPLPTPEDFVARKPLMHPDRSKFGRRTIRLLGEVDELGYNFVFTVSSFVAHGLISTHWWFVSIALNFGCRMRMWCGSRIHFCTLTLFKTSRLRVRSIQVTQKVQATRQIEDSFLWNLLIFQSSFWNIGRWQWFCIPTMMLNPYWRWSKRMRLPNSGWECGLNIWTQFISVAFVSQTRIWGRCIPCMQTAVRIWRARSMIWGLFLMIGETRWPVFRLRVLHGEFQANVRRNRIIPYPKLNPYVFSLEDLACKEHQLEHKNMSHKSETSLWWLTPFLW